MKLNKYFMLLIFMMFTIGLIACSSAEKSSSQEMEGIELELTIHKEDLSLDDEIVAQVTLTNHNENAKEVFVPIPEDKEEGISAVMIERQGEALFQLLTPLSMEDVPNMKERSFYDFVPVELAANETIMQEFRWDKELLHQESREMEKAVSGDYLLSAFVILDELQNEKDHYEPDRQLVSKLNFTVQ